MNQKKLRDKIARLESINDQLEAEIQHLDELMKLLGFTNGLSTIKETAQEIVLGGSAEDDSEL